jgi:hypothetical protein
MSFLDPDGVPMALGVIAKTTWCEQSNTIEYWFCTVVKICPFLSEK